MELISLILNFVLGSGVISLLVFYRSKQRRERAETSVVELGAFKAQIDHLSKQLKESFSEIDLMQGIIDNKREKIIDLSRKLTDIELRAIAEEKRRRLLEPKICLEEGCKVRKMGTS